MLNILIALFVLLFAYAATAKLIHFSETVKAMHRQPLATWLTDVLPYVLPIAEVIVVVLLIPERTKLAGLYLFTAMMIIFTGYIVLVLGNHFSIIPCSCGGLMKTLNWTTHLYFNICFIGMGIAAIYLGHTATSKPV